MFTTPCLKIYDSSYVILWKHNYAMQILSKLPVLFKKFPISLRFLLPYYKSFQVDIIMATIDAAMKANGLSQDIFRHWLLSSPDICPDV